MQTRKYIARVLVATILAAAPLFASGARATEDAAGKITAITQVFGDGQKIVAVAIQYDRKIASDSLKPSDFSIQNGTVSDVYTARAADINSRTRNGSFVIVRLKAETARLDNHAGANPPEHRGEPAGAPRGAPGPGGPKVGDKATDSARGTPVVVKVSQTGDIDSVGGAVIPAWNQARENTAVINPIVDKFVAGVYVDPAYKSLSLMYNLYVPEHYDPKKHYPLVLFMHDAGAVSNDPTRTLTQGLGAVVWASPQAQSKHPAFVLAPQYDTVITDDNSVLANQAEATVDLIKSLMTRYSIDPNRIYNTGQSMGGMTSIGLDIAHPNFFAASFLVACQWDPSLVAPMAHMPLWIVVSEGDTKAYPGQEAITAALAKKGATVSQAFWNAEADKQTQARDVAAMLSHNSQINFAVFKGGNHRYTWEHAYAIEGIRDWLFAQSK